MSARQLLAAASVRKVLRIFLSSRGEKTDASYPAPQPQRLRLSAAAEQARECRLRMPSRWALRPSPAIRSPFCPCRRAVRCYGRAIPRDCEAGSGAGARGARPAVRAVPRRRRRNGQRQALVRPPRGGALDEAAPEPSSRRPRSRIATGKPIATQMRAVGSFLPDSPMRDFRLGRNRGAGAVNRQSSRLSPPCGRPVRSHCAQAQIGADTRRSTIAVVRMDCCCALCGFKPRI